MHLREPAPVPSARCPGLSPHVDALILRCLAKAPADRFQSMTELAQALGQLLGHITSPESATMFAGHHVTPVPPHPSWSATPAPPVSQARVPTPQAPTTLGSSVGQVAPGPPPPRPRRIGLLMAAFVLVGVAGATITILARGGKGAAQPMTSPVNAVVVEPRPVMDAGVPADAPVGARASERAGGQSDAAVVDAAIDAAVVPDAAVHHHVPHHAPPPPHPGSAAPPPPPPPPHPGSATTPPGCDRSIDTDCDGIPDVR
jgi:hypothetical protein